MTHKPFNMDQQFNDLAEKQQEVQANVKILQHLVQDRAASHCFHCGETNSTEPFSKFTKQTFIQELGLSILARFHPECAYRTISMTAGYKEQQIARCGHLTGPQDVAGICVGCDTILCPTCYKKTRLRPDQPRSRQPTSQPSTQPVKQPIRRPTETVKTALVKPPNSDKREN